MIQIDIAIMTTNTVVLLPKVFVPEGHSIQEIVSQYVKPEHLEQFDNWRSQLGIWGKRCAPNQTIQENDRIELYLPLRITPQEARRLAVNTKRRIDGQQGKRWKIRSAN